MIDKNLFGEDQEYWDIEKERVKNLELKIKDLIEQNEDYENMVDFFYGTEPQFCKPPTFEEFFTEQKNHLVKLHDKCKNWDDFTERYYFIDATSDQKISLPEPLSTDNDGQQ